MKHAASSSLHFMLANCKLLESKQKKYTVYMNEGVQICWHFFRKLDRYVTLGLILEREIYFFLNI